MIVDTINFTDIEFKTSVLEVDKSLILFLVTNSNGDIIGKCSLKFRENNVIRYQGAFVKKQYRFKGIYKLLFEKRDQYVKNLRKKFMVESYCRKSSVNLFLKNGFEISHELFLVKKKYD